MTESSDKIMIALQDAISKLADYSKEVFKRQKSTPLQKTIRLFKSLALDKKRSQLAILQAIDIINRERLFIQKLKSGTPAEKHLAETLIRTVDDYNDSRECQGKILAHSASSLSKYLHNIIESNGSKLPKIDLPGERAIRLQYPEISGHTSLKHKTSPLAETGAAVQLSKQTAELFQMKALALLERYGIASNSEARTLVKNSPIITTIEIDTSICTLAQQLHLFPGQTVVVIGSSELDPKTQNIHRLFPETFFLSLESTQTGFPHPSQRTGWALANQLLPESPQRPDMLSSLCHFFERKKAVMAALLPQGKLINQAKRLLRLKKQAFEANAAKLIELHREFALTLLQTAPLTLRNSTCRTYINQFYDSLAQRQAPFDWLMDAHQKMRDLFIVRPHQLFFDTLIIQTATTLPLAHAVTSYDYASNILQKALDGSHKEVASNQLASSNDQEQIQWRYVDAIGPLLGMAAKQIILQYFSEDLLYAPPALDSFARKIQASAYQQAIDFMHELHADLSMDKQACYQQLHHQIENDISNDIALLKAHSHLIPDELENYYQMRHQSM